MKRGFSFLELLIGLVLGSIILLGLARYSFSRSRTLIGTREQVGVRANLTMAQQEISQYVENLEPAFWERFPMRHGVVHEEGHGHGGVWFSTTCDFDRSTSCVTFWDIRPDAENLDVFRADMDAFPDSFLLDVLPPAVGQGTQEVGPMSVLLFFSKEEAFCLLVADEQDGRFFPAGVDDHPWSLPQDPQGSYDVVLLGQLEVTHLALADDEVGRRLAWHPWTVRTTGWRPGQRKTSFNRMHSLRWQPCRENTPDRLVLLASPRYSRADGFTTIGGTVYQGEVECASVEF